MDIDIYENHESHTSEYLAVPFYFFDGSLI